MITFGRIFRNLDCALGRRMDQALAGMDLTFSQGHIIGYLVHCPTPPCAKDIEERFHLSHPTVSGLLARLEKKEFIALREDQRTGGGSLFMFCPKDSNAMKQCALLSKTAIRRFWRALLRRKKRSSGVFCSGRCIT